VALQIEHLRDDQATAAIAALASAEAAAGAPLVDEAERLRLAGFAAGAPPRAGWVPLVACRDGAVVGYAAVLVSDDSTDARGDAALLGREEGPRTLEALLETLADEAAVAAAAHLQVWVRHAGPSELAAARAAGYAVERRLGVLGRPLEGSERPTPPAGVEVRAYRPDEDDEEVVGVLAAAYAGTAEAGWDLAAFHERRAWSWFRAEDLLVAEIEHGRLGGIHWLKRRGGGVGEVYNLAVHPDAQGRRLGPLLLAAGLAHLREVGCHEVLLWVDLANDRAVGLYTEQGFLTRWEDVALARSIAAAPGGGAP
jgi:mycothiol synthase